MSAYFKVFLVIFLAVFTRVTDSSRGDNNDYYRDCRYRCQNINCSLGKGGAEGPLTGAYHLSKLHGIKFQPGSALARQQGIFDRLLRWTCDEECKDYCIWQTVEAFLDRSWEVPQFHGKWPFIRLFGLQEPASVLFSIMNFVTHIYLLRKFRNSVRNNSPCYRLWHIFGYVCLNGWFWSTVFHARDTDLTEFFDYVFAYSIVLVTLYCMVMRFLYKQYLILRGIITALFVSYYFNYFSYLYVGQFNYSFNMKANIVTGALSATGWIMWALYVRKRRPYAWKMIYFYLYLGAAFTLEYLDFSPFLWTFDAHSLWHLSSVPMTFIIYSFAIDDCKQLRKEKATEIENKLS